MPFAFAIFEERLDTVIVQTGPVSHVSGSSFEHSAAGFLFLVQQRYPQQIIHCFSI
jgi:hypothetical protein